MKVIAICSVSAALVASVFVGRPVALIGGTVLAASAYALACARKPLARCRRCAGTGTRPGWSSSRGPRLFRWMVKISARPCRRCKSTGRRIRLGRRAYDYVRELQQAGTRGDQ